jgi:hypothetical protein
VVNEFITTHHFGNVLKLQRDIISDYTDDIAKYAEGAEKTMKISLRIFLARRGRADRKLSAVYGDVFVGPLT